MDYYIIYTYILAAGPVVPRSEGSIGNGKEKERKK